MQKYCLRSVLLLLLFVWDYLIVALKSLNISLGSIMLNVVHAHSNRLSWLQRIYNLMGWNREGVGEKIAILRKRNSDKDKVKTCSRYLRKSKRLNSDVLDCNLYKMHQPGFIWMLGSRQNGRFLDPLTFFFPSAGHTIELFLPLLAL